MIADAKDFITPHIVDSHHLDYPCFPTSGSWLERLAPQACERELPRWAPIHIGSYMLDISPTKHVVMLWIAAVLTIITLVWATRSHGRTGAAGKVPTGFANGMEAVVLYLRNQMVLPNVGPHGKAYVPFVISLFFFVLFANLLGLLPYMSTPTGNISVTATLAIITFIVVEIAGMKAQGKGYINTIFYWPHDLGLGLKLPMTIILTPIEIIGKLTKPFALAIRLFANMIAGHIVLLALISLIFTFGSFFLAPLPIFLALGIMLLELFVAFLQAFIFALLSSVFIGLIRQGAH